MEASKRQQGSSFTKLSTSLVSKLHAAFIKNDNYIRSRNAVCKVGIDESCYNHYRSMTLDPAVSLRLDDWFATSQGQSGRCWIFAITNLFRSEIRKTIDVKNFEISQNFIMFYDKLERVNYFLEAMEQNAHLPEGDRTVTYLLEKVMQDGGQWHMAINICEKYGVVPKVNMPETFASMQTDKMNRTLKKVLRGAAMKIRNMVSNGANNDQIKAFKKESVIKIHRILSMHLGSPPEVIEFKWRDDNGRFHNDGFMTPREFYNKYVTVPPEDFVCLVDDPRIEHPRGQLITVDYLGNVVGASQTEYLNIPIKDIKQATLNSLQAGHPVWFGCDVRPQLDRDGGKWATDLFEYSDIYNMEIELTKEQRVRFCDSKMTHAMLFTGVDLDTSGKPTRWRVENSWGADRGDKGFYIMQDLWFDEYVFEVVVHKSYLSDKILQGLDTEPIVLPPWDPMGALAN
ncbi:MAG: C1 family peptidase [Bifidobacteriaceae bacterium]|jgi:bleomycin hydrolase|nr:C1 family peptidase [Bifidobacteriaceae bacterium]